MILHSVAPLALLLPPDEAPPLETQEVPGGLLCGRRTPQGFEVSRLISTDPGAYLRADWAPGAVCRR